MTNQAMLKKIDWFIILYGVLLCAGAEIFYGTDSCVSVLVGVLVAFVSWKLSSTVGGLLVRIGRVEWLVFALMLKSVVLLIVVFLVLLLTSVHPVAFAIGLSALVVSILMKSFSFSFVEDDNDEGDD